MGTTPSRTTDSPVQGGERSNCAQTPLTGGSQGAKRRAARANLEELGRRSGARYDYVKTNFDMLKLLVESEERRRQAETKKAHEVSATVDQQDALVEELDEAERPIDASASKLAEAEQRKRVLTAQIQDLMQQRDRTELECQSHEKDKMKATEKRDVIAKQKEPVDLKVSE
ncbi:hypothetical protein E8E12_009919 [Didymella heteroderae]|uniref:Uncharacterized protein n=1 Tax=Didymella heteroderae TaxID=1769908 RepID=A0A9P5C3X6_9PLEO|nr:hypothetical protein E8E12_009919 [Didymella heteroderae]